MKKKQAFSLAEVLIAIAILGVVVLLVVSGIKSEQQQTQLYLTQYDKVYNDVFTASKTILTLDRKNTLKFSAEEDAEEIRDTFQNRLDVSNTWEGTSGWVNGANGVVAKIDGAAVDNISGVTLNNGVSLGFMPASGLSTAGKNFVSSGGTNTSPSNEVLDPKAEGLVGSVLGTSGEN